MALNIWKFKCFFCNALFCIIVVVFFGTVTLLRPPAVGALYKEFLTGAIALCLFYSNRYIFYPRYYLKGKINQYLLYALISVLFAAFAEFALIYPNLSAVFTTISSPVESRLSCIVFFFLTICRDAAVYLSSSVFCNYIHLKQLNEVFEHRLRENSDEMLAYDNEKSSCIIHDNIPSNTQVFYESAETVASNDQLVDATVFFKIKDILYFEQIKSTTFIHTINDRILIRNSTLLKVIALIGAHNVIQISKDTVVVKEYVNGYDDQDIHLLNPISKKVVRLKWSTKYKKAMLPALEKMLEEMQHTALIMETPNEKQQVWEIPTLLQQDKVNKVYFYVCNHTMCKASELSKGLKLPTATVNRILAQLKKEGLIEYVGSKKTGGYRVV